MPCSHLLFRWFVGMARRVSRRVVERAKDPMSDEHFTVDGTLIEAWASQKTLSGERWRQDGDGRDCRGEQRKKDTPASKTDQDVRFVSPLASGRVALGLPRAPTECTIGSLCRTDCPAIGCRRSWPRSNMSSIVLSSAVFPGSSFCVDLRDDSSAVAVGGVRVNVVPVEPDAASIVNDAVGDNPVRGAKSGRCHVDRLALLRGSQDIVGGKASHEAVETVPGGCRSITVEKWLCTTHYPGIR